MPFSSDTLRTRLFADPEGKFVHDVVLDSCRRYGEKTAILDASCSPVRRLSYAEYGDMVERVARGLMAAGISPGDRIAVFLPNCWEFAVTFHAVTLAGAVPTTLNPTYREREVRYQLENSGAVALVTDGRLIKDVDLGGLPPLRSVYTTRSDRACTARSHSRSFWLRPALHPCTQPSATRALLWRHFRIPVAPLGCRRA